MSNNCFKRSLDLLLFYVFIRCRLIVFFDVLYCFSVDVVLCCIDVYCCSVLYCNFVPILQYSVVVEYSSSSYIQSYLLVLVQEQIFTDTLSSILATCLGTIFLDSLT